MMRVGLCSIALRDRPLEEVISLAGAIGFDGIEVWGKEPHLGSEYEEERVRRVRKEIKAARLRVAELGSYVQPLTEQFDAQSEASLSIAETLRAPVIRIWSPPGAPGTLLHSDYTAAVKQLRDYGRRATMRGLILAIESHQGYIVETADGMLRLIEDVGSDALRVNWQPSFAPGGEDPYRNLERLLPYVVNVHCQNFTGPGGTRTQLDAGSVDYRRIAAMLGENGYEGFLEIEFLGDTQDRTAWLRRDFAFLKALADGIVPP